VRKPSAETPEARELHPDTQVVFNGIWRWIGRGTQTFEIARRVVTGVWADGFLHAGNLAYLTLLTLFPFFIVATSLGQIFGFGDSSREAVSLVLRALPPDVSGLVGGIASDVATERSGSLLWFGIAVGLWTITSFIETLRDILRRAYGADYGRPFWQYRLAGIAVVILAVVMILFAFSAQLTLTAADELVSRFVPAEVQFALSTSFNSFLPTIAMYIGLFVMFWTLTPQKFRKLRFPVWPGAAFTTLWWLAAVTLMPRALSIFSGYALTYGSLAGVMIALLFFWVVGYGLVIGAHLNAALVNPVQAALKEHPLLDELVEAKWLDT
jgi:membrane protein